MSVDPQSVLNLEQFIKKAKENDEERKIDIQEKANKSVKRKRAEMKYYSKI